jgi:hypothetical protein
MPDGSMAAVLGGVDNIIRTFEVNNQRRVSTPGRLVIQQFFISLATDRIGFNTMMSDDARQQAIQTAHDNLSAFLDNLDKKAQKSIVSSAVERDTDPTAKPEIGLLLVVQNINSWALQINCPCWPR